MCWPMCTENRYSSAMSCTGQSEASHSSAMPSTRQTSWRRRITGSPRSTPLGPTTVNAWGESTATPPTRNQTPGCGWNRQKSVARAVAVLMGASVVVDVRPELHGRQHDPGVHDHGQDQPEDEQPAEHRVVELEVH